MDSHGTLVVCCFKNLQMERDYMMIIFEIHYTGDYTYTFGYAFNTGIFIHYILYDVAYIRLRGYVLETTNICHFSPLAESLIDIFVCAETD